MDRGKVPHCPGTGTKFTLIKPEKSIGDTFGVLAFIDKNSFMKL